MNDGERVEAVPGLEVYELQSLMDMIQRADRAQCGIIMLHAMHELSLFTACPGCGSYDGFEHVKLESGEETEICRFCGTVEGGR